MKWYTPLSGRKPFAKAIYGLATYRYMDMDEVIESVKEGIKDTILP